MWVLLCRLGRCKLQRALWRSIGYGEHSWVTLQCRLALASAYVLYHVCGTLAYMLFGAWVDMSVCTAAAAAHQSSRTPNMATCGNRLLLLDGWSGLMWAAALQQSVHRVSLHAACKAAAPAGRQLRLLAAPGDTHRASLLSPAAVSCVAACSTALRDGRWQTRPAGSVWHVPAGHTHLHGVSRATPTVHQQQHLRVRQHGRTVWPASLKS